MDEKEKKLLEETENAKRKLAGTTAEDFLKILGVSPVELTLEHVVKIKVLFPVPKEQFVLWADAEFDLRPSGIVCTDEGIFIKSDASVWAKEEKKSKKDKKEEKQENEKSVLTYFKWVDFEPAWFISTDKEENRALAVDPKCSQRFIAGCHQLAATLKKCETETHNFVYHDDDIESITARLASISAAGVLSADEAVFAEQKSHINTPAGHGEMAEEMLTRLDRLFGMNAKVVGRDNLKDGADRLVDGIFIQTKFYNTARGSVEACFRPEDGLYRYMHDGKPMQLEVPKDQYAKALEIFRYKIKSGKVPGVSDPGDAEKFVRKSRLTYQQAVNLTKAGTIESLTYDALTGIVTCGCAFGITFVTTLFLTWRKTGSLKEAVKAGMLAGVQVFGLSFIQHMLVNQIARTGLANALIAPSQFIVSRIGYQNAARIVNGIRFLSGKGAIHGASASKHLAKILRSNVLTSTLTFIVFSIPDTYRMSVKKISSAQYAKNLSNLVGSIVGGASGAVATGMAAAKIAGAAGTSVSPGLGTVIGIVGGFLGGMLGSVAVNFVGNIIREDDAVILGRLFNAIVSCMIGEYLLDASEVDKLIKRLDEIKPKEFKALFISIYQAEEQEKCIREFMTPHFEAIIADRQPFALPSLEYIFDVLVDDLEEEDLEN